MLLLVRHFSLLLLIILSFLKILEVEHEAFARLSLHSKGTVEKWKSEKVVVTRCTVMAFHFLSLAPVDVWHSDLAFHF